MRLATRTALAAVAALAFVGGTAGTASASPSPHPCSGLVDTNCYIHDPNGSYSCTPLYVAGLCLFRWAP